MERNGRVSDGIETQAQHFMFLESRDFFPLQLMLILLIASFWVVVSFIVGYKMREHLHSLWILYFI